LSSHPVIYRWINKYLSQQESLNDLFITACNINNSENVLKLIKNYRVDPSFDNNKCILMAVQKKSINVVEILLNYCQVDPSINRNECFITAMSNNEFDIVDILLKDPEIDPIDQDYVAFREGIQNFSMSSIELSLRDYRVDIDKVNRIVLDAAERFSKVEWKKLNDPRYTYLYNSRKTMKKKFIKFWKQKVEEIRYIRELQLRTRALKELREDPTFNVLYNMTYQDLIKELDYIGFPYIPKLNKMAICLILQGQEYENILKLIIPHCSYLSFRSAISYMKDHNLIYNNMFN
jgi:hypothetical protein